MEATVKWKDGVSFEAESGSGHTVVMDGPPDLGAASHGDADYGDGGLCLI